MDKKTKKQKNKKPCPALGDTQRCLSLYISIERSICHMFSKHSNSPKLPFFFILLQCFRIAYLKWYHSQWCCQNKSLGSKSEVSSSVLFLSASDKCWHCLAGVFSSTVRWHFADVTGWDSPRKGRDRWRIPLFLKEFFHRYNGTGRSPFLYHSSFDILPHNFEGLKGMAAGF